MRHSQGTMLQRAKALRSEPTIAEARLWYNLRAGRLDGIKFRRQVPLGAYIVDFVALSHDLVIEVDGDTHSDKVRYDNKRTDWLEQQGYRVLRFANADVMGNEAGVLEAILAAIATPPSPRPSPRTRGEGEEGA